MIESAEVRRSCTARASAALVWMLAGMGVATGWTPLRAAQAPPSDDLKIVIIDGDGFTNNLKKRIAREPIVEVRDRNDKPVAGAAVTFTLPSSGPGGTFPNGSRVLNVVTGPDGRAKSTTFRANSVPGQFIIGVTASFQGQRTSAVIGQTNMAAAGAGIGAGATLAIVGAVAAAAAVTALRVLGNGNKTRIGVGGPTAP